MWAYFVLRSSPDSSIFLQKFALFHSYAGQRVFLNSISSVSVSCPFTHASRRDNTQFKILVSRRDKILLYSLFSCECILYQTSYSVSMCSLLNMPVRDLTSLLGCSSFLKTGINSKAFWTGNGFGLTVPQNIFCKQTTKQYWTVCFYEIKKNAIKVVQAVELRCPAFKSRLS